MTTRREFLGSCGKIAVAGAVTGLLSPQAAAMRSVRSGSADRCIFLWLGGGACHIDTWDPKRRGDPATKTPGSYYDPIDTAIAGVQVCEHLPRMANLLDRCALLRSVHHNVIDEHAAATNRLHTGRPPAGTTQYPSIGSVVAHQLADAGGEVPGYVVMGYPSASRGPGFLGAQHGYIYLTDTEAGPAGLRRPEAVTDSRQQRREQLLDRLRNQYDARNSQDQAIQDYLASSRQGFQLAGPKFMNVFDLKGESDTVRESYGSEFGQRCLLARRLVEAGVAFVEVSFNLNFINGTGWDTHNEGQRNQHILIQQLDQALATLITDLEQRQQLDRTLIVVATEFGRPPEFDGRGGRGHHSQAFSIVMAGGGVPGGRVFGVTDELGKTVVEQPISVPDLHATIYSTLGIDPAEELYDGERPVPITDRGHAVW